MGSSDAARRAGMKVASIETVGTINPTAIATTGPEIRAPAPAKCRSRQNNPPSPDRQLPLPVRRYCLK